jgi:hypothetical protein
MGENFDQLPDKVKEHVRQITKQSGHPDTDESLEMISKGWLEKKNIFEEEISKKGMEEIDSMEQSDERGCLAMTYSGSLLNIGPLTDEGRKVSYASIGLREDVPAMAEKAGAQLESSVTVDAVVSFSGGPIKSSSPLFKIAVSKEDLEAEEQEELINEVTQILAEEFVDVNKTMIVEE